MTRRGRGIPILMLVISLLLGACGGAADDVSGSSTERPTPTGVSPPAPSAADVGAVSWPVATADVQTLSGALPREIAGMRSDGSFEMDDQFPVIMTYGGTDITYDGATAAPVLRIAVMNADPGGPGSETLPPEMTSPGAMLMLMFALNEGCAPETVQSDPEMQSEAWTRTTGRTVWFTCEVGMVQNHGELVGPQRRHLAGWAGPGTVAYLVDAPTEQARDEAVAALVAAARTT